jgi:CDK-activating kinase assembly factor MAT1
LYLEVRVQPYASLEVGLTTATSYSNMSKASAKASVAAAKDGGASHLHRSLSGLSIQQSTSSEPRADTSSDICPVCKSSRYLNPNMRFLVNPECYHKMCESCVDRIFSHGPAPCPIAGCKRTLRKVKFRTQTFEDLKVEREVDIRRRVALACVASSFSGHGTYADKCQA